MVTGSATTGSGTARFGVYVNNRAAVFLGDGFSIGDLVGLACAAEDGGIDFVAVGDSLLAKPRYSPIVTLGGIATVTSRIGLTTGILQPHLRHPVWLAQEWATLDALSDGRTSLAVGLGTGPRELVDAELSLVGLSRRTRAGAFEDAIVAVRRLWSEDTVSFEGSNVSLDGVSAGFAPVQAGGPPIVIACGAYIASQPGTGPNDVHRVEIADTFVGPFERVARLGDGWVTGMATPEEWRSGWHQIRHAAGAVGRVVDHSGFERRINTFLHVDRDEVTARREGHRFLEDYHRLPMDERSVDRWLICGPPEVCARRIQDFVDVGVNSFQFVLASHRQLEQLERLVSEVRPLVEGAAVAGT